MEIKSPEILLIGDPRLRQRSDEVLDSDLKSETFIKELKTLEVALDDFRKKNGFGR